MNSKLALGAALAGAVVLGAVIVAYGSAQTGRDEAQSSRASSVFEQKEQDEIEAIVRQYILDNPEVLIEALNAYGESQQADAEARMLDNARSNLPALLDPRHGHIAGANPDEARVAVIELFDYHCGFCKRAAGMVKEMTSSDPAVKVVFRDLPILREESDIAARAALAAREQDKFEEMHFAMMNASGVLTRERIEAIAREEGLDVDALTAAMEDPAIDEAIDETVRIAQEMAADGTPTFIVASVNGDFIEVIPGLREADLRAAIEEAKKAS